ncbi:hypothetical protein diail_8157 [Diaporthe ilicicola]|nr:hypothetical protein diail_8157 [Diaporthe ilicicola]
MSVKLGFGADPPRHTIGSEGLLHHTGYHWSQRHDSLSPIFSEEARLYNLRCSMEGWDRARDKVEHGWDETVDAVEDGPENIAEGIGSDVGKVERYGDHVEDYGDGLEESYDQGRDEARYD